MTCRSGMHVLVEKCCMHTRVYPHACRCVLTIFHVFNMMSVNNKIVFHSVLSYVFNTSAMYPCAVG